MVMLECVLLDSFLIFFAFFFLTLTYFCFAVHRFAHSSKSDRIAKLEECFRSFAFTGIRTGYSRWVNVNFA